MQGEGAALTLGSANAEADALRAALEDGGRGARTEIDQSGAQLPMFGE
tara:strand:+ start:650 stop:793 length:144 start_codon:yes stop_codon:yes gene_type:complete